MWRSKWNIHLKRDARKDGKDICKQKREMRILFAKANQIDYVPSECTYKGPCAGACKMCDLETLRLMEKAQRKREVVYPKYDIRGDM